MSTAVFSHKSMAVSWYCPANTEHNFILDLFKSNFMVNWGHRSSLDTLRPHRLVHMMKRWNSQGPWHDPQLSVASNIWLICRQRTKVTSLLQHPSRLRTCTIYLVGVIQAQSSCQNLPIKTVVIKVFMKSSLSAHVQAWTISSMALLDWRHLLHWHPTVTLILCLSVVGIAKLSDATQGDEG